MDHSVVARRRDCYTGVHELRPYASPSSRRGSFSAVITIAGRKPSVPPCWHEAEIRRDCRASSPLLIKIPAIFHERARQEAPVPNSWYDSGMLASVAGMRGTWYVIFGPFRSLAISVNAAVMFPPTELPAIGIRLPSAPNSPACSATHFSAA